MGGDKHWSEEDEKKLLAEYKTKDKEVLAKQLGRSLSSIYNKYVDLVNERKPPTKPRVCPICGSRRINRVVTCVNTKLCRVNYCLNCLHEFTDKGEIIPPL